VKGKNLVINLGPREKMASSWWLRTGQNWPLRLRAPLEAV
jgi:hypothetical protein